MNKIALADTGRQTTQLGYGCSSIMGGMGRKQSLAILEAAFDAGIRHFDVAPMYGYGEAEACLGEFIQRHPGQVTVTTKYGIPPARNRKLIGVARSLARPVIKFVPALKSRLTRVAGSVTHNQERASFTAAQAQQSLERSLAALRTDRIDVWLLHEVEAQDLNDDGLLRLLEDLVAKGTIGTFGIGSGADKVGSLIASRPQYCRTLQYEWSVLDRPVTPSRAFRIHHRALTHNFRSIHTALLHNAETSQRWSAAVGADLRSPDVLAHLMLKAALVMNPESITLFSSKSPEHIRANVQLAGDATLEAPARQFYQLVQAEYSGLEKGPVPA